MGNKLAIKVLIFMFAGAIFGLGIRLLSPIAIFHMAFISELLRFGGQTFIALLQLIVVPIVFVAIVSGICSIDKAGEFGRVGLKAGLWFLITTLLAILLGILVANFFGLGLDFSLANTVKYDVHKIATPSLWQFVTNIIPTNPVKAMAEGHMLQVMVFAILIGLAISAAGESGRRIAGIFSDLDVIFMKYVLTLMNLAPYGVFCLMSVLFAETGVQLILDMLDYFVAVFFTLLVYVFIVVASILYLSNLSPKKFFAKVYDVMLFAFGISSSTAAMPLMLETAEHKLGVSNPIASFVIPLGVNINKNGTAIMQSIATLFIAHIYHIHIDLVGYLTLIPMILLVSMATAAVPGVGLLTLVMILEQLDLPIEGIAIVIGVDRVLDMLRTAVNVSSNTMIACLVAKSEGQLDYRVYESLISTSANQVAPK